MVVLAWSDFQSIYTVVTGIHCGFELNERSSFIFRNDEKERNNPTSTENEQRELITAIAAVQPVFFSCPRREYWSAYE